VARPRQNATPSEGNAIGATFTPPPSRFIPPPSPCHRPLQVGALASLAFATVTSASRRSSNFPRRSLVAIILALPLSTGVPYCVGAAFSTPRTLPFGSQSRPRHRLAPFGSSYPASAASTLGAAIAPSPSPQVRALDSLPLACRSRSTPARAQQEHHRSRDVHVTLALHASSPQRQVPARVPLPNSDAALGAARHRPAPHAR
jgi:hypothetical protein